MQVFSEKVNRLLIDLEKSSEQFWNIPREVGQLLYFLAINKGAKKVLEIGTSNGYSGIWLAKAMADLREGVLITVESNRARFDLAAKHFFEADLQNHVQQILGHAPEVFNDIDSIKEGDFDMIFMDATKKQHVDFLEAGLPLLSKGGLIVADNVLSHKEQMQSFVDKIKTIPSLTWELLSIGDGLIIAIRN